MPFEPFLQLTLGNHQEKNDFAESYDQQLGQSLRNKNIVSIQFLYPKNLIRKPF